MPLLEAREICSRTLFSDDSCDDEEVVSDHVRHENQGERIRELQKSVSRTAVHAACPAEHQPNGDYGE